MQPNPFQKRSKLLQFHKIFYKILIIQPQVKSLKISRELLIYIQMFFFRKCGFIPCSTPFLIQQNLKKVVRGRSQTTLTRFWLFFTTYTHVLTFSMLQPLTNSGHFWTTYLPCLVNVVCERPLYPVKACLSLKVTRKIEKVQLELSYCYAPFKTHSFKQSCFSI